MVCLMLEILKALNLPLTMYLKHLSLLKEAFVIYLVNIFIPTNNLNVDLGINMYPLVMIKIY